MSENNKPEAKKTRAGRLLEQLDAVRPAEGQKRFWEYLDKGVLGLFELLGLLFGLPFGDDLYQKKPFTGLHLFYLGIGALFAIGGPMFPLIRGATWIPQSIAPSISRAARDARIWIAVLLAFFFYGVASDIYQRATRSQIGSGAPPTMKGLTQTQVNERIATAVANLSSQLAEANQERDAAKREASTLRQQIQSSPRVYTNKTIDAIFEPCEGRTQLQCDELIGDEKGKWIKLAGRINFIQPNGQVSLSVGKKHMVNCIFGQQWKVKLGTFRNNEMMSVRGRIQGDLGASMLILDECELDD